MASSALQALSSIVVPAVAHHTATVIFAHGFGATSSDWVTLSSLPSLQPYVKWIFPQAPMRPITIAGGAHYPAWHDILQSKHTERKSDSDEDEAGMMESLNAIQELVEAEVESGIDRKRIMVGGFSQGSGMALLAGIMSEIGGTICLSGYAPLQWKLAEMKLKKQNSLPIFWAHGTADAVIAYEVGKGAADMMTEAGMTNISFYRYRGMGHSYCEEELKDLNDWFDVHLPPLPAIPSKI